MSQEKITINATVLANRQKVWNYYTEPVHITKWNFADPSWHCPNVKNDLKVGGSYVARMEAKDGSFGFDIEAVYTEINQGHNFTYVGGGRFITVEFKETNRNTDVIISFDPEKENPIDLQRKGWQAILDNFKKYTESN